ncbi:MAG TPA: hypothetical protein VMD98_09275 [Bryocella sp.]|nr:hypothetical protein [Bryocella sp.]
MAVTVVFALIVTLQDVPVAVVHPDQDEKELLPDVAGAVSVTDVPEL